MKLAVMQPYFMPYLGYFQMINAVDKFVVYDDVSYIRQGWINRNRILLNGKDFLFTIPLKEASSFRLIKDTELNDRFYEGWKTKFYKTLEQGYKKAPYFESAYALVLRVLESESRLIGRLAVSSIREVCQYLGLETEIVETSSNYQNQELSGQERIIDICKREKANEYINLKGGMSLYSKSDFAANNIDLHFIGSKAVEYKQFKNEFIPWLSMIDVLMFNSTDEAKRLIKQSEFL